MCKGRVYCQKEPYQLSQRSGGSARQLQHSGAGPTNAEELEGLDSDFRTHHLALIDLQKEEALEKEQEILDVHDEAVTALVVCINQLVSSHPKCGTSASQNHVEASVPLEKESLLHRY